MKKNGIWYKEILWAGKYEIIECKQHSYAYSGKMPCTGQIKCILCGKPKNDKE